LSHRARPSYIPEVIAYVRSKMKSEPQFNVVEIGSGTGIFTQALLTHPDWTLAIKKLQAIEPSEGMRNTFSENVKDERVSVREGAFDSTEIDDGWADIVLIAQAFHWCPDYDRASAEFARILKPTGIVAMVWNLEDRERARWVAQVRDRVESHEAGTPQFRLMKWRQTFKTVSYSQFFDSPEETTWPVVFPATRSTVIDRACSKSYIAVLDEQEKERVKRDVEEIVERGEDKVWIDEHAGVFEYPYKTWLVIASKK
ncbi:hypothetical protein M378DRAFT_68458, partial [Amanita muscaria Koide BX008]